jgi:arsenate reductase
MLYPEIQQTIESLDLNAISEARKTVLQPLIDYIQKKTNANEEIRLHFICTHNSRRSHLSQVWSQAMAAKFEIKNVVCYSGGTEATALFIAAKDTLVTAGFQIQKLSETKNPVYAIKYSANSLPIIGFSKTFEHYFNPVSEFAAILTCSQADEDCPFIAGAEKRIPIMYMDPKAFDNTPLQKEKYIERSMQIATEMYFVFSKIRQNDFS